MSHERHRGTPGTGHPARRAPARRLPAVLAVVLVVLGVLAVAVRLDAPADGARVTAWLAGGVVIATDAASSDGAATGPGPGWSPGTWCGSSVVMP